MIGALGAKTIKCNLTSDRLAPARLKKCEPPSGGLGQSRHEVRSGITWELRPSKALDVGGEMHNRGIALILLAVLTVSLSAASGRFSSRQYNSIHLFPHGNHGEAHHRGMVPKRP